MSTADDEPSSALNGRLRPRKSNVPSPQALKPTRSADGKSAQDKPKGASPSASVPDDLTTKSELSSTPQFLCPYCDKNFASKQTVSKHVHRVHFSASKQDTSLDCLFCNHAEADGNIVRHMVDSHPNQYFACLDCHTRFPSTTELANHKLNICEKQKMAYNSRLRSKVSTGAKKKKKLSFNKKEEYSEEKKDFRDDHGFNGIVISCELKPSQVHDEEDIEDNITTNLILPPCKSLVGSAGLEKNAVIVLDDIQWNKRIPPNFSFHNTDHTADQILSRLGVVHRSPRTGESTRRNWLKSLEDTPQKFEKCFDTSFYSKVASNVQENLSKYLDGSFNFNPDPHNTIKTRKLKNSVAINTAEGFPILLACEQYSRSALDSYLPRCIAPKHKWKWDNPDGDRNPLNADQLKRDSHVNNCIITLVSSLDIWTQLSMRRKFENKFGSLPIERKIEKKNIIGKELKEILESREIPSRSQVVLYSTKTAPNSSRLDFPSSLGLAPSAPPPNLQPAVLSGEWVRPRCYVCCACGAQTRDPRALSSHNSTHHPNSQVQHYEIVGEPLLNADIMQHLYVPPKQMANRTRPPRGIKDCTKCGKPISLEELHQHMLDCAGDTPTVRRRTCRYRPFGVRKRRTRLPDNTIRKKIRKDIRTSHGRQKKLMRSRPKIRSEVGDAETIRKMLADLPAKRHRVMINPMNMIPRPRRKIEQQRSKMLLKKRPTHNRSSRKTFNAHSSDNASQGASTNSDDPNKNTARNDEDEDNKPLRPRIKRVIHKITMHNDTLKRQTLFNERKSKRPKRKPIRMKQQREAEEPSDTVSSPPPSGSAPTSKEISVGEDSHRIDVRRGPYNTREQANRGGGGARGGGGNSGGGSSRGGGGHRDDQQPGGSRPNENPDNHYAPAQNTPLKHSIASLTSNSETQDKAVQFHHLFLVQQECNDANQHVPTGRQTLFENEAVVTKLDKPPLSYSQRAQADYYALQKNSKLSKTRKGLNDCIAMLKNKLVDPVPEVATGHVSVQCGSDEPIGPLMPSQMTSDLVGINSVSPRGSFEVPHIFIPPPNQFIGVGTETEIHMKQHDTVNKQDTYSTDNQQNLTSAGKQQSPIYEGNQQSHISASNEQSPIYSGNQHDHTTAGNQQSYISGGNQQSHISGGSQQSSSGDSKQQSPISAYTQQSPNSEKQHSPVSSNQKSPNSDKQPSPDASKRQTGGKRTKRRSNSNFVSQEHLVPQKVYQTRGIRRSQRKSTAQFDYDRAAQKRSLQYGPDIGISPQKSFEYLYQEARRKSIEELSEIAIALQKPTDYKLYERAYRKSAERNVPPRMSPQKSSEYQYGDNPHGKIVESSPEIRISPRKSTEYHPYYEIPQTKRIDRSPVFGVSPQKPVEYPYPKVTQNNVIPEVRMTSTQPSYHYNDLRKHLQISPEISITQQKPADYLYCQIAPINPVGHYPEMQISPQRPVPYQYCELLQKKSARRSVEMQVSPQKYITSQYRGQSHPPIERVPEIEVNPRVFDENKFREMMLNHPIEFGPEIFNGQQNLIEGQYLSPSSQKPQKIKTSRSSSQKSRTNSETEVQRFSEIYPTNDNFLLKPVIPSEADKTWRKNNESLPRESSAREQILPEVPLNAQATVYPEENVNFAPQPSTHPDRDAHLQPESFSGNAQTDIHTAHGDMRLESSHESVPLDLSKATSTNAAEKVPTRDYLMYNYDNYETIDLVKNSSDEDVLIDVENDGVVDLSVKAVPPGYETETLDLCMKSQADNVPTDLSMKRNENVPNMLNGVEESQPIVDFPGQKTTLPELEHQELTQSYNDVSPTDLSSKIDKTMTEPRDTNIEISTDTIKTTVRDNSRVTHDFLEQVPARSNYGNRCILEDEFQRPSETTEYKDDRNESLTPVSNATKTPSELDAGEPAVSHANITATHIAVTQCDNLPPGLKPTICKTSEASSVNDLPVNKKLEESDLVYKHGNASYSESIIETSTLTVTKNPETITRDNPPQSTDSLHIIDTVTEQKTTPVSIQNQKQNQTDQEKETKDIDPTLDNDPETAKKIALLPKELVDILGNMPVDHRNQLLNILPQYVSTPTISSTSPNSSIQTTTNTTAQIATAVPCQQTTVTKSSTISQTDINTQSIPQPAASPDQPLNTHLMKSQPNIKYDALYSNALATPMSILVKPQSNQEDKSTSPQVSPLPGKEAANNEQEKVVYTVYTSTKSGANDYHAPLIKTYDYKLSNNEAKHVSSDLSRTLSIPNPNLTNITDNEKYQIQKKSNDQTASLRAVRIKAPSERQKDSQILKRSSIEQLSKPNINETEVTETIIEKSLAIQQAEVSSTQHHSKNDEGEALISEAYDADLELNNSDIKTQRLSTLTPDAVIASMPENKNEQIDGPTENEVPKQSVVTSSITCLKYDSENLTNPVILNETIIKVSKKVNDALLVESKLDDIPTSRRLVSQDAMIDTNNKDLIHDSKRPKINEIEFEDDSDDDISLAAIVKQKRNQQKILQCVANVEKSVSRINDNKECIKKKKKGKKHKKERRYHQVAENLSHKMDTSPIVVAYSSSDTCETESTSRIDNTTEKDSTEENLTDTGLNTSEKVKKQNLDNDKVKDKDTISDTSRNTIGEEVSVGNTAEGLKTLKHAVSIDSTTQEISPINSTEVITKKIRLNEIDDSNNTLKSSHLDEYSTCDSNSSHFKNSKKNKSKKNKKHPSKSLNIILSSQNDNDMNLTSLPKTNLIKDGINNEISKEKINKTQEENIILDNNIDEQIKASDPVPESLKLNSETNLSTTSELDIETTKTPLRRSRRGKSLFVHNDLSEQSIAEKETESIDQKTPFTKKQLIFSKLLHDEEINAKLSVDESVPQEMSNKDNSDNNLSSDATTSVTLLHENEQLSTSESSIENKSIKRKKSPHVKGKCKKKKILVQADCTKKPKLASNSDNNEMSEQASSVVSTDVKKTERNDDISPINEASNVDTCDDNSTETYDNQLLIFIEKRKINNDRNNDDGQSSRAKKIKFNKNLENPAVETEIRSNKTNEAENKESPKASATRPTMCYNMPVASRRTRSKSVVEKTTNTDLYDPYNIDLDEMDEKAEPFRATGFMPKSKINFKANKSKLTELKSSNKQESLIEMHTSPKAFNLGTIKTHSKKSKCETIVSGEYAKTISESKKDVVDESGYRELHTANDICNDSVKGNISDSDDSTRSDVPLKKYVEEKQKKMAMQKTLEKETEHSDHSEGSSGKSKSEEIKKKQKNSISTVSILNEADEQLRSEQFMESFGFFSQRKPRKSNLLASKKIAATFHVIANDNDDMYFGPNQRITRKNPQSSSTSRRVTRRAPKKKNCDKTLSCLCRICQKLFRRPDNLMRHQLTLLHVSRLSELDLKFKTNCIPEEPNYLCAFKQYLDRLKRIAVKMGKYKKNPRFKLKMPTVKEVIENVHKGVLDQRVTSRNLSRDEALFLDCCELLKESHRNNVPPVTSFLPNHLFCAPKAAGTSRKSVEAMFKEDKPGETTPHTCVCSHKPGDAAPHSSASPLKTGEVASHSPTCPNNPVNIALHSSDCPHRSVEAAIHSPNCPHNPINAKPHSSTCPLRSGEVASHSSASLQKTEEAAPLSSTGPHKPGDAAPHLSTCSHKHEEAAPHSSASPHKADEGTRHSSDCPHKPNEAATHSSACPKAEETKDDGDVDSITAKAILESEEVRKLEKDLISVFKTARPGTFGSLNINNQPTSKDREASPTATVTSALNQAADSHDHTRKESKDVDPSETSLSDTVKSKKQIEVKDKMYPDIEEFDMFEDKFDKIKRKSRSQAAAAKMAQPAVHTSVRQARKKSDTKKGKKRTKKKSPSTVLTKGALKGFDSLKVSIPTSDINISALTQAPESPPKRKKKANSKKKKNKAETDTAARSHSDDAPHRTSPKKDVYEFRDNEDAELFEFRPSTVMERFKLINNKEMERFKGMSHKDDEKAKNTVNKEVDRFKGLYAKEMDRFKPSTSKRTETYTSKNYPGTDFDIFNKYADAIASTSSKDTERLKMTSKDQPSTSKAHLDYGLGDADDDSSQSASDGDDFVYMSDHSDEVCSDDETRSTMSCEIGKNDLKKNTAPLKRKDAIEKNVVMGKIFKHNAVRAEKRIVKVDEPAKPNIDQLFDSLLYNEKQSNDRRAESPDDDTAEEDETPKYEPSSVNVYDSSTTTKKNLYTSPKKSCTVSPHFEPTPSTSFAGRYQQDSPDRSEVSTNRYKMPSQSRYVDPYEFGPSTSKKPDPSIDLAYPSTSKQYDLDFLPKDTKYSSPKKNERSHPLPAFEGPSTSKDTSGGREKPRRETEESNDRNVEEDAGVARQRARRKCTVGKQNVLAESWSSESEPDGAPPRPGSAQSDSSGGGRRKRGKRKETSRKKAARKVEETRVSSSGAVEARAPTPPGAFVAPLPVAGGGPQPVVGPDGKLRSVAYYWSSEGDEEQEHLQQHGWIVGDSHKKLVTMLAHAKGRKRNNDDKCHSE